MNVLGKMTTRPLGTLVVAALCVVSASAQSPTPTPTATSTATRTSRPTGAKGAGQTSAIVNLNTAKSEELQQLPGVGAKTAERIIDYRQKKGPFKKIEEVMNVQGIGEKSFLKLKPQITVGGITPPADPK